MLSSTHLSRHTAAHTNHMDQASDGDTQLITGNGEMASVTSPAQTSPLLALPTAILVYLLQYLHDKATPLVLSTLCHQLRSIYQDEKLYNAQERQTHLFIHTLTTPVLYNALNAKLPNKKINGIRIPDPHTPEWIQLRNHPLPMSLVKEAWQTAFIQKTYLTAWDLLQTAEYEDKPYVLKLMQIIGQLSSHISNAESYTKKIFNNTFPEVWLQELIAINLDWGLQLIGGHFAWHDIKPFVTKLDPALSTLTDAQYKSCQWQFAHGHKPYGSFLSDALEHFYLLGGHVNVEFTHPDIKAQFEKILSSPSVLRSALRENNFSSLDLILSRPNIGFNITDENDNTLLHKAIALKKYPQEKSMVLIKRLLESGVDCNATDANEHTPLMLACKFIQEDIVSLLIQQPSIDINLQKNDLKSLFTFVICPGQQDELRKDRKSALVYAVENRGINIVKMLLKHEISFVNRLVAFNLALKNNQEDIATLLWEIAQNQQDFIDQALARAITDRTPDIIYKIIKNYAGNPNFINDFGSSALTAALSTKDVSLFDLLFSHPNFIVDIRKNAQGKTVLHYFHSIAQSRSAIYSDKRLIQLVNCFIEQGGNYNLPDEEGNTPLMLACLTDQDAVVNLLLQQPLIEVNAKNNKGGSALRYAVTCGTVNMVQALLKHTIEQEGLFAAFYSAIKSKEEQEEFPSAFYSPIESKEQEKINLLKPFLSQDFIKKMLIWTWSQGQKEDKYSTPHYSSLILWLMKEWGSASKVLVGFYPLAFTIALREAVQQKSKKSIHLLHDLCQMPDLKIYNKKDHLGNTPLVYAVQLGKSYPRKETIQLIIRLFRLGIDVNAVNKEGNTALIIASQSNPTLIPLLLQHPKININIKGKSGHSALDQVAHTAVYTNDITLLEKMLEHDISPESLMDAFNHALHIYNAIHAPGERARWLLWRKIKQKKMSIEQIFLHTLATKKFGVSSHVNLLIKEFGADQGISILSTEEEILFIDKILQRLTFKVNIAKDCIGNAALINVLKLNYPEESKLQFVKRLLEYGVDCNASNEQEEIPLIVACEHEQEKLVHLLLQQPAIDINVRNDSNESALDYAVRRNMMGVIEVLLNHSLPLNHYFSAFGTAIICNKSNIFNMIWQKIEHKEVFLNQALDWVTEKQDWSKRFLRVSRLQIMPSLIKEFGANPNIMNKDGLSLLAAALKAHDITLLDMLLVHPELQINKNIKGEEGETLLHWAISLQGYPLEKHLALLERLLKAGVDYDTATDKGLTPLMLLAQGKQEELLPLLLQYRPDIEAKDIDGLSALDYAVRHHTKKVVQIFLKHGVEPDILLSAFNTALELGKSEMIDVLWQQVQGEEGFNHQALRLAITQNYAQAAYKLIKAYQADPEIVNNGFSALNVALKRGHISLLNMLSCSDIKISLEKDSDGNTALMYALALDVYAEEKKVSFIQPLLEKGVDCSVANKDGETPLMFTCRMNQFALTALLLQYAPAINVRDNQSHSALDYAVIHGTVKLVQALLAYGVEDDMLVAAFNQAIALDKDNMAEVLLRHADRSDNGLFIHQALTRAIDEKQQKAVSILRRRYGAS
jgi:ankyrin repeat protein